MEEARDRWQEIVVREEDQSLYNRTEAIPADLQAERGIAEGTKIDCLLKTKFINQRQR